MCASDGYTIPVVFGSRLVLNGLHCCLNADYNAVLFCWAGNPAPSSPCITCFSVCVLIYVCACEAQRLALSIVSIALHPVLRQDLSLSLTCISLDRMSSQ